MTSDLCVEAEYVHSGCIDPLRMTDVPLSITTGFYNGKIPLQISERRWAWLLKSQVQSGVIKVSRCLQSNILKKGSFTERVFVWVRWILRALGWTSSTYARARLVTFQLHFKAIDEWRTALGSELRLVGNREAARIDPGTMCTGCLFIDGRVKWAFNVMNTSGEIGWRSVNTSGRPLVPHYCYWDMHHLCHPPRPRAKLIWNSSDDRQALRVRDLISPDLAMHKYSRLFGSLDVYLTTSEVSNSLYHKAHKDRWMAL